MCCAWLEITWEEGGNAVRFFLHCKSLFFSRSGFKIHFRKRTCDFVVLLLPCVFVGVSAYVFAYLSDFLIPKMLGKNSPPLRLGF